MIEARRRCIMGVETSVHEQKSVVPPLRNASPMGVTLDALHRLQDIESQLAETQRRFDRKQRSCNREKRRISELDAKIQARRDELRTDQVEADRLELDAKSVEEEITKFRVALNTSKTNKEYSAVLTQLNTLKADNSKLESRILLLLSQIDEKKKQMAIVEVERDQESAKLTELEAALRAAQAEAQGRLTRLRADREQAAAAVPDSLLVVFDRVAQKNDGEAMAMVTRTHPKRSEYACEGCNMSITIEQVNAILSRDEAVLCNVCGKILFVESPAASNAR